jgi:hypothetical protein
MWWRRSALGEAVAGSGDRRRPVRCCLSMFMVQEWREKYREIRGVGDCKCVFTVRREVWGG